MVGVPLAVHYDVDGLDDVEHQLLGMAARAVEPRPLLEAFAEQLRQMMGDVFEREGPGWDPLAPATIARKGSSVIGRETDAMMDSLTTQGGEGHLEEFFGDELVFGTNLTNDEGFPYPVAFNDGTSAGQPGRQIFSMVDKDLRRFTKAVHVYLMGAERGEFGVGSFGMGLTTPFGV